MSPVTATAHAMPSTSSASLVSPQQNVGQITTHTDGPVNAATAAQTSTREGKARRVEARPPARPPSNLRRPRKQARHANASQGPNRPLLANPASFNQPQPTPSATPHPSPISINNSRLQGGPIVDYQIESFLPLVSCTSFRDKVGRPFPECHPNSTPQNGQVVYPRAGWVAFHLHSLHRVQLARTHSAPHENLHDLVFIRYQQVAAVVSPYEVPTTTAGLFGLDAPDSTSCNPSKDCCVGIYIGLPSSSSHTSHTRYTSTTCMGALIPNIRHFVPSTMTRAGFWAFEMASTAQLGRSSHCAPPGWYHVDPVPLPPANPSMAPTMIPKYLSIPVLAAHRSLIPMHVRFASQPLLFVSTSDPHSLR
ncbi:uncharacterized protein BDZ83DRAFT_784998 [Colletotrichum acutatum]|uniref:Uncharacterized protein n=1 Tax=Glomerella acutata TaxID=27357 RepID=A0AAD8XC76_GLOAC|nr:uncharacterized protein BDZ83DRAFT_784998 [Colletotrichum acutatum]KAK1720401.1 hypothetical protein BDZ83DRAFT_784998 [Colletotrichum acutatum]